VIYAERGTYGVMGIELRMREPSADGVAPFRAAVLDLLSDGEEEEVWPAGVSRTSLRNWLLFILETVLYSMAAGVEVGVLRLTALLKFLARLAFSPQSSLHLDGEVVYIQKQDLNHYYVRKKIVNLF